jgi:hypothetical protein
LLALASTLVLATLSVSRILHLQRAAALAAITAMICTAVIACVPRVAAPPRLAPHGREPQAAPQALNDGRGSTRGEHGASRPDARSSTAAGRRRPIPRPGRNPSLEEIHQPSVEVERVVLAGGPGVQALFAALPPE